MRVSVVIPTYNCGHFVTEAVASVLAQTHAPAEVIVVDDGSTDDTRERMAAFAAPVKYVYQANQGVAAARNRGIREATGDFVAFLDADDVWHPRKAELQLACFAKHPEVGLIGTHLLDWPHERFPDFRELAVPELSVVKLDDLVVHNQVGTSSVMVRRSVLAQVGEFDRALHGPEDYDLWLRVAQVTAVANIHLPLMGYRDVAASLGKQAVTMEKGVRIIYGKLESSGVFRGRPLLRRKAWSFLFYSCAYLRGAAGDYAGAVRLMLQSLGQYPLPYRRSEVKMPLARPRLLVRMLFQRLRQGQRPGPHADTSPRPVPMQAPVAATIGSTPLDDE